MDNNWWRPTASVDTGDWRTQLPPDARQRIVNKIMETLMRHIPFSGQEGLQELKKIAVCFEEKIYAAATSQPDYLRKISLKMLTMESRSPNPLPVNPAANSNNLPDPAASHSMQTHVPMPGPHLSILSLPGNQSQAHRQLLSQNFQDNMATAGVQVSLLQSQSLIDQQKLLYQSQKALPDTSSTSLDTSVVLPPKESAFSCPICMGPFNEETTTRCGHIFCKKCITAALAVRKECPTCRRRVVAKTLIRVFLPTTD